MEKVKRLYWKIKYCFIVNEKVEKIRRIWWRIKYPFSYKYCVVCSTPLFSSNQNFCDDLLLKIVHTDDITDEKEEKWTLFSGDHPKNTDKCPTMWVKTEVFQFGELFIIDMWGREISGARRKPDKWGIINPTKEEKEEYKNSQIIFRTFKTKRGAIKLIKKLYKGR